MVAFKYTFTALAVLLVSAGAAPTNFSDHDKQAPRFLVDDTKVVVGNLPDWGLIFRASGYLAKGGCPASTSITTCYAMKLSSNPKENLDPDLGAGSQSNFVSAGAVAKYTSKLFLDLSLRTPSAASLVPLVQIVSKEPVDGQGAATKVYFDVRNNVARIYAFSDISVVSVPLSSFTGKTTAQTWIVKRGPQGYVDVDIKDLATSKSIVKYRVNKPNTISSDRVRIGPIRLVNKDSSPYG